MLIRFLKNNNFTFALALPFIASAFWLAIFFGEKKIVFEGDVMPFYATIQTFFSEYKVISGIISILLIVAEALLLNFFIQQFHLLKNKTFLPALLYTVLMCAFPENLFLHPVLFANVFLIFALKRCLDLSASTNSASAAFDSAFLISLGSLFYFPAITFAVFVLIALVSFRSFSWRDWLIAFIGIGLPYLFLSVYYFWFDEFFRIEEIFISTHAVTETVHLKSFYSLLIFLAIMFFISLPSYFREMAKNKAGIRSSLRLFLWLFLLVFLSFFMAAPNSFFHFSILAIPLSIIFSNYFLNSKIAVAETIFSFLIFFIIIYQLNYF